MTAWSNIFSYITGTFPDVTAKAASGLSAKDGTEWKTTAVDNFWFGPIQALFNLFGKTPDGVTESKSASQILELWRQLAAYKELQTATTSDALVFGDKSYSIELDCSSGNLSIPTLPLPDFRGQTIDFVVTGSGTGTITAGSGLPFDIVLYSAKGLSLVAVEKSSALQWEVLSSSLPIGVNQSWQDLTLSRASNTQYTNTTGRPIKISVTTNAGQNVYMDLYIDSTIVSSQQNNTSGGSNKSNLSEIIPAGSTYKVDITVGSLGLWSELR